RLADAAVGQGDVVLAWRDEDLALAAVLGEHVRRRLQVPDHAREPGRTRGRQVGDRHAGRTANRDRDARAGVLLHPVVDDGADRRVGAAEGPLRTLPVAPPGERLISPCLRDGEQVGGLLAHIRRELLERPDVVDDVETATVGRNDQVAFARVNQQVIDRYGGQPAELRPRRAAVETRVETELGACEEQIRIERVFAHDTDRFILRQTASDTLPRLALIGGAIDERAIVTGAERADREVRDVRIVVARLDARDPLALRFRRQARRDVDPLFARVVTNPHLAIVRAGPQHAG